jgi:hypothetical protein
MGDGRPATVIAPNTQLTFTVTHVVVAATRGMVEVTLSDSASGGFRMKFDVDAMVAPKVLDVVRVGLFWGG